MPWNHKNTQLRELRANCYKLDQTNIIKNYTYYVYICVFALYTIELHGVNYYNNKNLNNYDHGHRILYGQEL